jgi:hypothetical protein
VADIAGVDYFLVIQTPYEMKTSGNKQLYDQFREEEWYQPEDENFQFKKSSKTQEQERRCHGQADHVKK